MLLVKALISMCRCPSGSSLDHIIQASTYANLSSGFANNKGADRPAHLHSLISAFVIRFWKMSYLIL